ncbi:hypothetical protein ECFRIK1999_3354, partial [Escherichia coli FRIK1999]
GVPT